MVPVQERDAVLRVFCQGQRERGAGVPVDSQAGASSGSRRGAVQQLPRQDRLAGQPTAAGREGLQLLGRGITYNENLCFPGKFSEASSCFLRNLC